MRTKLAAAVEMLEVRSLLSAVYPTAAEQYGVELLNRARANPSAEAARYGIDLNEGLSPGAISMAAKQPLAINPNLTDAARGHSSFQQSNSAFGHTGNGGSSPFQRMNAAGYTYTTAGENVGINWTSGALPAASINAVNHHQSYFVDEGVSGRGHRKNQLSNDFREVGVGYASGPYNVSGSSRQAFLSTQDFGTRSGNPFLTGVAYSDAVTDDNFYTVGEGMSGITITARRASDNASFTTTTWSSGGYSLQLAAGTYTVTASGTVLNGVVSYGNVTIASQNVKVDVVPGTGTTPPPTSEIASISGGVLTVTGTSGRDQITLSRVGDDVRVTRGTTTLSFDEDAFASISIDAGAGDDVVRIEQGVGAAYVFGGEGNDQVYGSSANDTLSGGAGKDSLWGAGGNDLLNGGGGHDMIYGENGNDKIVGLGGDDKLYGSAGNDTLEGGEGNDRVYGDAGADSILGGVGKDTLYGGSGNDTIRGDAGNDRVDGETGADSLDGGDGIDAVSFESRTVGVTVTLDTVANDGEDDEGDIVLPSFEIIIGGSGDDYFVGTFGAQTYYGNAGRDTILSRGGNDTLYGGDDSDWAYVSPGDTHFSVETLFANQ